MEKDNTVRCAGGFIIQLMPFATEEEVICKLEENYKGRHICNGASGSGIYAGTAFGSSAWRSGS